MSTSSVNNFSVRSDVNPQGVEYKYQGRRNDMATSPFRETSRLLTSSSQRGHDGERALARIRRPGVAPY